jgi:hypothetical protein
MEEVCKICSGSGRYHKFADRDVYEGYKLAPLYYCSCPIGQKKEKTKHIHLASDEFLTIHYQGKIYEFDNGKLKKINKP